MVWQCYSCFKIFFEAGLNKNKGEDMTPYFIDHNISSFYLKEFFDREVEASEFSYIFIRFKKI